MEAVEAEPDDESIEEWSQDQLRKRSKELQLVDENGQLAKHDIALRNCDSRIEEITLSEVEEESKSASRSTTSDSQVSECPQERYKVALLYILYYTRKLE